MLPKKIRETENLHIVMWLLKDTCWVMDWRVAGMFMIVPTLTVAIYITWKMREHKAELFHNLAVCNWITANCIWMIGEFFYNDTLRPYARVFFALGILMVIYYYAVHLPVAKRRSPT
ncbi:MAG: hypothetical protein ACHQNT_01535 [Bacteroidia bacterium]